MRSILAGLLLAAAACAQAQDPQRGRVLYETYCGTCHYERLHERPKERSAVQTLPDLRRQVEKWAPRTRLPFTGSDIEDVVAYLNRSHYRLGK